MMKWPHSSHLAIGIYWVAGLGGYFVQLQVGGVMRGDGTDGKNDMGTLLEQAHSTGQLQCGDSLGSGSGCDIFLSFEFGCRDFTGSSLYFSCGVVRGPSRRLSN